jgi:hypothetical protein
MLAIWLNAALLTLESHEVILLRVRKLARGGPEAKAEARLMVSEKVEEALDAGGRFMEGASLLSIVSGYRSIVSANATRLSENGTV